MFGVLKRTVLSRRFFWKPITYVLFENQENIFGIRPSYLEAWYLQPVDRICHCNITHRYDIDDESQFFMGQEGIQEHKYPGR